jgi:integrase
LIIIDFIEYLLLSGLSSSTRALYLTHLGTFFDLCIRESWIQISDSQLIYPEDMPSKEIKEPRYIPLDVINQLNQHLHDLPPHFMRMLLIIQEAGMRIGELLTMPQDCLVQDSSGDWFLRYYQSKMKKEHSIPITRSTVAIIQEQQEANEKQYNIKSALLFPGKRGKSIGYNTFIDTLNELAVDKNIRDANGNIWRFQSHQFRHTVGERMINNGVPQHIIQRYLGHETPTMTSRYAYIHDQTLKAEYERYANTIVDINGVGVRRDSQADTAELQWFKKNILAQSLPNGHCSLPIVQGSCPHANACLTCTHFRTDRTFLSQHKEHLLETQKVLEKARANKWQRQIEMNERVEDNLKKIIIVLEPIHQ